MKHSFQVAAAFGIGIIVASGATLAQSYGRGRNVQFVDGATISPTNVTASGTADQFVCTSTTATCEVESSASATTMTSTVPAFDIGPTATPGANDRLACFSYGPSGSKTRLACVDAEGDVATTGSFNSSVASGNQAYTCTNTGCRLSLGNTGRYLVDDGTNLEFVAPVQATSFEATTASGSSLTGGGASGPLLITSNTPDSHTSTTVPAVLLKAANALAGGDSPFAIQSSTGTDEFRIRGGGTTLSQAIIGGGTGRFSGSMVTNFTGELELSTWRDAGAVIGVSIGSFNALTGDTAKPVSIRNGTNFTTEVAHFSKDGLLRVNANNAAKPTCNSDNRGRVYYLNGASGVADTYEICAKNTADAYAWVQASLASDNTSAPMELLSNTPDSVTSNTVPAIRLRASQNITDTDLLLSVEDSAGNRRVIINEVGTITASGNIVAGSGFVGGFINMNGYVSRTETSVTIPDNGAGTPAAYTWQPGLGRTLFLFTCNDADGCDITMSETGSFTGVYNMAVNVSANNITFTDTAGVTEMAGNFTAGQWDMIQFIYITDRFVETDRSDN